MFRANAHELDFEDDMSELGAGRIGKKIKKKLKKVGKAFAVVSTGGLAAAPMLGKKLKKAKVVQKAKKALSVAKKAGAALGVNVSVKAKAKPAVKAAVKAALPPKATPRLVKAVTKVATKTAGDCKSMDEMAKLVAAQLVAKLGPPLTDANKILRKFELQRQATYEHKRLMTDEDFRRNVLSHLTAKAANGNQSCERTIRVLMGR